MLFRTQLQTLFLTVSILINNNIMLIKYNMEVLRSKVITNGIFFISRQAGLDEEKSQMEVEQRHYDDRFCVMFYILHSPLDIKRYTLKGFVECKSLFGLMMQSLTHEQLI